MARSKTTSASPQPSSHLALGRRGEELAAAYLEQSGYRLVAANVALPVGRNRLGAVINVEIDLVAYDGATLCFVEVKTRTSDWFAAPEANVLPKPLETPATSEVQALRKRVHLLGKHKEVSWDSE